MDEETNQDQAATENNEQSQHEETSTNETPADFGDDPEAWRQGYSELKGNFDKQNSEIGSLRDAVSLLTRAVGSMGVQEKAPEPQAQKEEDTWNSNVSDLLSKVETGDYTLEEGFKQVIDLTLEKATRSAVQEYDKLSAQRNQQKIESDFLANNPDFTRLRESGGLDEIKNQLPGLHDDFSAYFAWKSMQTEKAFEDFKKTQKIKDGADRTKFVDQSSQKKSTVVPGVPSSAPAGDNDQKKYLNPENKSDRRKLTEIMSNAVRRFRSA